MASLRDDVATDEVADNRATRVLLVEDHPGDATLVGVYLESSQECFDLSVAASLSEAQARLRDAVFDVVLLDLSLPDSRGLGTLEALLAVGNSAAMVVMTGNHDEQLSLEAAEKGADAYLVKGEVEPGLLARTLRYAIRHQRERASLEAEQRLSEHRATHDALTGLPNRMLFLDRLDQALHGSFRTGRVVGLLFVDLDHFKEVNDTFGHASGDELLRAASDRLRHHVRSSDTVGRLGGDEFVVLLTNVRQADDVESLARKIGKALCQPLDIHGRRLHPSASVGVAVGPMQGGTADELLAAADAAMYRAKRAGRGQLRVMGSADASASAPGSELGRVLTAIERQEIDLVYRPRIDTADGCVEGLEMVPRTHPGAHGATLEGRALLTVAEEEGAGEDLLDWLIEQLVRDRHRSAALRERGPLGIALAAAQILRPGFTRQLARIGAHAGLRLELYVPDALLAHGFDEALVPLAQVCRSETRIVLEHEQGLDTAQRALSVLRPDAVRLHTSRLGSLEPGSLDEAFLCGLSTALDRLGIPWTADGIERPEQAHQLCALGCRALQGPLFGGVVPLEEIEERLRQPPAWRPVQSSTH